MWRYDGMGSAHKTNGDMLYLQASSANRVEVHHYHDRLGADECLSCFRSLQDAITFVINFTKSNNDDYQQFRMKSVG